MTFYADLGDLEEDKRIEAIGKVVMVGVNKSAEKPIMAAFVVENDEKADRYIAKLRDRFPGIRVVDREKGPVPDTVLVRVAGPLL